MWRSLAKTERCKSCSRDLPLCSLSGRISGALCQPVCRSRVLTNGCPHLVPSGRTSSLIPSLRTRRRSGTLFVRSRQREQGLARLRLLHCFAASSEPNLLSDRRVSQQCGLRLSQSAHDRHRRLYPKGAADWPPGPPVCRPAPLTHPFLERIENLYWIGLIGRATVMYRTSPAS